MAESDHKSWVGRVALVTGAASGNGKATVKALAKHGMVIVGCDIDLDNLKVRKMEDTLTHMQFDTYFTNLNAIE